MTPIEYLRKFVLLEFIFQKVFFRDFYKECLMPKKSSPKAKPKKIVSPIAKDKPKRGTIAILTGGGDVPGLNPAIRAITVRANREGFRVVGIRRGWAGLIDMKRTEEDAGVCYELLTDQVVRKLGRTGGTFLHSSRTRPSHVPANAVPEHLKSAYKKDVNDLTKEVVKNLEYLGVDYLIPIGGDDTLSYGVHLHKNTNLKVIAIPKTMDNDVPGTDYCIGFSTCISRTIEMTNALRTSAGSHERFLVIEVFGRYAGYTALLPTLAGASHRCVIPEYEFEIDKLAELLVHDRSKNPSKYSIVLASEGATFKGCNEMVFEDGVADMYGHKKLGGIGDLIGRQLKEASPKFHGSTINVINQRLGYLVRCGEPDAMDSIVPLIYGNIALDLILDGKSGRLTCLRNGQYDNVPIDVVTSRKKVVDVDRYYNIKRLRPNYAKFTGMPFFLMTSDY